MPTKKNLKASQTTKPKMVEIEVVEKQAKKIKELEAENKALLVAKTPPTRGDHEIIHNGVHYHLNFNELIQLMDGLARQSRYSARYLGASQAQLALAKILGIHSPEDSGQEQARQLILKYAGN